MSLAEELKPPGIDATTWWRLVVSGCIGGILIWITWAMGFFAFVSFPGMARADKLDLVLTMLQQQKISEVEKEIRDSQSSFCAADGSGDDKARGYWLDVREAKRREYWNLTRDAGNAREYPLPSCED